MASPTPKKYCSERCRGSKPGKMEHDIESAFIAKLGSGEGETRGRIVDCHQIEEEIFASSRFVPADMPTVGDSDDDTAGGVPLGDRQVSAHAVDSRQLGMRRAREREMVRQAARRLVAFGVEQSERLRKVECIQKGRVVESSFAKGDWGIRWKG